MIRDFVKQAILEDIGRGDLFSLIGDNRKVEAKIISKQEGILAGEEYVKELCKFGSIEFEFLKHDGEQIKKGDIVVFFKAESNTIMMYERVMLNILQHASGIATNMNRYIKGVKGQDIKLLDTRKTRPLLRVFEKYSVRCGGGNNHRLGLDDCLMLKDTHLATIDDLDKFIKIARKKIPYTSKIEIECESPKKAVEAMKCGADLVMCDNMQTDQIKKVVDFKNENFSHVLIEASGNITAENIQEFAKTGVDAISSGSIIHQSVWLDFSMRID